MVNMYGFMELPCKKWKSLQSVRTHPPDQGDKLVKNPAW
jgi:hypothetical protein